MTDYSNGPADEAGSTGQSVNPETELSEHTSTQIAQATTGSETVPAAQGPEWKISGTDGVVEGGNASYQLSAGGPVPETGQSHSVQMELQLDNSGSYTPVENADFTSKFADAVKSAAPAGFTVTGDGNGPLTITIDSNAQETGFSFTLKTYDDGHVEAVEDFSIVLSSPVSSNTLVDARIAPSFREARTIVRDNDQEDPIAQQDRTDNNTTGSATAKTDQIDTAAIRETVTVTEGQPVVLPADFQLAAVLVSGNDLVLRGTDGSLIVISDGVNNVPTIQTAAGIEIPANVMVSAINSANTQTAAGEDGSEPTAPASSGGNFAAGPGQIGDPFDLTELLPPTAFDREFTDPVEFEGVLIEGEDIPPQIIGVSPEALLVEEPDLDGIGTTPGETGETDSSQITILAGSSTVNAIAFSPDQSGIQVTGLDLSLSAPIVWAIDSSTGNLVGTVDGTEVIRISLTLNGGIIPADNTGTADIEVELLGPLQNLPGNGSVVVSNISLFVTDTNGETASTVTSVEVIDDAPVVSAVADDQVTAALDEGDQDAGSPSTGVTSVINTGAITKGDDPHVVNTNGDAIAAASTTEALVDITALFGADGPATTDNTQYALAFTNTTSGLTLTDG
uniref:hypothetical protein n=1 Tax=Anderseniella sp. Alg231-50 TaxID=1922226 RepID=UPI00307B122D